MNILTLYYTMLITHIHSKINTANQKLLLLTSNRICLPFKLFPSAFLKTHSHGHAGEKLSLKLFNQYYYIPHLPLWFSIFIHDCLHCQTNKHISSKPNVAPSLPFYENATHFNYRISMDTKGPINPTSNGNQYIYVIIDAFSHYIVTVPTPTNNSRNAINALLSHWIVKFGPPQYFVTDRGTEFINTDMTHICSLFNIRHSPRTPYSPWTNGLVEVQNRNLGTHLRIFLQDPPNNWSTQASLYAYAHNTTPINNLKLTPHQIVFHTTPRIPLTFELNLTRNFTQTCTSTYCEHLPQHSHYEEKDLNPFFSHLISKPISSWLLAAEEAMLQIYSTVHQHLTHKLNSSLINFHLTQDKALPVNTFVIHKNFKPVHFSAKLKPLRIGPYKIVRHLSDVTYELLAQDGSLFHTHRNHLVPYYPKEPLLFHHITQYQNLSPSSSPPPSSLINNPDITPYQNLSPSPPLTSPPPSDEHTYQNDTMDFYNPLYIPFSPPTSPNTSSSQTTLSKDSHPTYSYLSPNITNHSPP